MASLKEYFDADFSHAARVSVRTPDADLRGGEAVLLYDFSAHTMFLAFYIPEQSLSLEYFNDFISKIQFERTRIEVNGKVTLPSTRTFPGTLEVRNSNPFEMRANFHGDPDWISSAEIGASSRVFLYSESQLSDADILSLKRSAKNNGLLLQFRSTEHAKIRSKFEAPLAFICHDSRDKELIAKPIAIELQRMLCPTWYDEFSLKVGDNLRTSIEKGLKECRRCVLILSEHFFSNQGWTKKEFDSIFTREILEGQQLVLPVWHGITKEQVFDYCPSLLNVKGTDWNSGAEEVCRQLYIAIMGQTDQPIS